MEGFKSKVENAVAAGIIATGLAASPEAHAESARLLDDSEKSAVMRVSQDALGSAMTENTDGTYSMKKGDIEIIIKINKQTITIHALTQTIEVRQKKVQVGPPKL